VEREIDRGLTFQAKIYIEGICKIPVRKYFLLSYFLFTNSILHVEMAWESSGVFSACFDLLKNISMEEDFRSDRENCYKLTYISKESKFR